MIKFLIGMMCLFCLVACATTDEPTLGTTGEKVKVTFNVSALGVDVTPMSRATAMDALTKIDCAVRDYATFTTTTSTFTPAQNGNDFGQITLWLAPGTYKIGFVGAGKDGKGDNLGLDATSISFSNRGNFNAKSEDKDTFGFQKEFEITANGNFDTNITLERCVGKLGIQINGKIPDAIKKVAVEYSHYKWISLSDFSDHDIDARNDVSEDLEISDGALTEYGRYIVPGELWVTINTYDETNKQISSTRVHINMYANKRTIIKGNATNLLNQTPFEILVDDEWESDVIVPLS